jgi:AraC family transcriptional regulator
MVATGLEPWTNSMRLDHSSRMTNHRYADRFSVVRVETTGDLPDAIRKSSSVPALLVSVFLRPVAPASYRLSIDGASVPIGSLPAFSANVVDLAASPTMWGAEGIDYVHFHVRRNIVEDAARELGYERLGGFRRSVGKEDLVLAQIARNVVPYLGESSAPSPLALDHLELILGAHLVQRYSEMQPTRSAANRGLAEWQRRRVTEMLRASLNGSVRLSELALACEVSVSHFTRSFKATFGVTCQRWLLEHRVEHAQHLLSATKTPIADIAVQSGFADQAAFTRTFRRIVGVPPGRWRREWAR